MHRSLIYWIQAQYRANPPPTLAADAGFESFRDGSPANAMRRAMHRMSRRWMKAFDKGAEDLAKYFVDSAAGATDVQLMDVLKKAGFSVEFRATANVNNAMQAAIGENVGLIKSIASEHLSQVEGIVMRSMQNGRDLATLTQELTHRYGVTSRRASFIARDQANKMTAVINRTRQKELGITQAHWRHSHGGKHPRKSHIEASQADGGKGKIYDIEEGCLIDGEYIWPGELPNCRCTAQSIVPGLEG
ncbi:phage head morphogenesis protein [Paraburkholderia sp. T12-10]|nr:phage head morphogenesis protein [Paraburkholderia sp. T12-10]